ncbi:MAG: hypothetical protein ACP5I1_13825, partial [Candidatus Hinthialibacter sp.]
EEYYLLAAVGILTTLLSFYYYLRVVVFMYMHEPQKEVEFDPVSPSSGIAAGLAAAGVLVLGVYPNLLWRVLAAYTNGL